MATDDKDNGGLGFGGAAASVGAAAVVTGGVAATHGAMKLNNKISEMVKKEFEDITKVVLGMTEAQLKNKVVSHEMMTNSMLKAFETNGIRIVDGAGTIAVEQAVKHGNFDPLIDLLKTNVKPVVDMDVKKFRGDLTKALTEELKTTGKNAEEAGKIASDFLKTTEKDGKALFTSTENAVRRLVGASKYKSASWHEKPFVAFESMSTKGKVGLGALAVATTVAVAGLMSRGGKSHVEQLDAQRGTTPDGNVRG